MFKARKNNLQRPIEMSTRDQQSPAATQELHLCPVAQIPGPPAAPTPLRLRPGLTRFSDFFRADDPEGWAPVPGVMFEPILNANNQFRLLVAFPRGSSPQLNGEPAPHCVVVAPGDHIQWLPDQSFRLALFRHPAGRAAAPIGCGQTVPHLPCPVHGRCDLLDLHLRRRAAQRARGSKVSSAPRCFASALSANGRWS